MPPNIKIFERGLHNILFINDNINLSDLFNRLYEDLKKKNNSIFADSELFLNVKINDNINRLSDLDHSITNLTIKTKEISDTLKSEDAIVIKKADDVISSAIETKKDIKNFKVIVSNFVDDFNNYLTKTKNAIDEANVLEGKAFIAQQNANQIDSKALTNSDAQKAIDTTSEKAETEIKERKKEENDATKAGKKARKDALEVAKLARNAVKKEEVEKIEAAEAEKKAVETAKKAAEAAEAAEAAKKAVEKIETAKKAVQEAKEAQQKAKNQILKESAIDVKNKADNALNDIIALK